MRKISADIVYPVSEKEVKNGIIVISDDCVIRDVLDPKQLSYAIEDVERYKGVITPGFVNAHCHLELSHLHNKLSKGKGLDHFIKEVQSLRASDTVEIEEAIIKAEAEMIENGIVAVGDISNTNHSFAQKAKGRLFYHTFIEVLGFHADRAETAFLKGKELVEEYEKVMFLHNMPELGGFVSLTPHAPYSASNKLLGLITEYCTSTYNLLTIHNQESGEENELFLYKKGRILERLSSFGIETETWAPPGTTSLQATLPLLPKDNKLQLVHNTFTTEEEIKWAKKNHKHLYWCLCTNANLYIEKELPNVEALVKNNCRITLGTDSLASNDALSILEEMKTIQSHFPDIPFTQLLNWATINGAEYLGIADKYGTIEKRKKPGLNLISDIENDKLNRRSNVKAIKV